MRFLVSRVELKILTISITLKSLIIKITANYVLI
jgi:hypothetical protein